MYTKRHKPTSFVIVRSSISNNAFNVSAQCSPRHACPLKGVLLMQGKGGLSSHRNWRWSGVQGRENTCKTMHLLDTWLNSGKMTGFTGNFLRPTARPARRAGGCKSCSVQG
ncbi:hypothetical protein FKK72_00170 [Klebsiella pneumoniae]|nr:hypothetical protein [Klebsiella pneumoniae]